MSVPARLRADAVDGDEQDLMGGGVEREARAGSLVGGRLGDDDGPVFDPGVGKGLVGEALRVVEAGAGLRVDLFDEPVLDVDDRGDGFGWGEVVGHAEAFTDILVVGG
ncbi:MAG: hypothetical protein GXP36_04320 [Actinobacteria bacterium]|nr:hypothetical protein [Actinomycetota bacterium]